MHLTQHSQVHHVWSTGLSTDSLAWGSPDRLQKSYDDFLQQSAEAGVSQDAQSRQWLCSQLEAIGLQCYEHTFKSPYPQHSSSSAHSDDADAAAVATSLYTIVRPAGIVPNRESLVLTTEIMSQQQNGNNEDDHQQLACGLGLALALLHELQKHVHWLSLNVIVLFSAASAPPGISPTTELWYATQAFIDDYTMNSPPQIKHNAAGDTWQQSVVPMERGGRVRAALCLDFPMAKPHWSAVRVLTTGANGALPNLDLPTVAAHLLENSGSVGLDTCLDIYGTGSHAPGHYSHNSDTSGHHMQGWACNDVISRAHRVSARWWQKSKLVRWLLGPALHVRVNRYLDRLFMLLGNAATLGLGATGPHMHFLRYSVNMSKYIVSEYRVIIV